MYRGPICICPMNRKGQFNVSTTLNADRYIRGYGRCNDPRDPCDCGNPSRSLAETTSLRAVSSSSRLPVIEMKLFFVKSRPYKRNSQGVKWKVAIGYLSGRCLGHCVNQNRLA